MTLVRTNRERPEKASDGSSALRQLDPENIREIKPSDLPYELLGTSTGRYEFALLKKVDADRVRRLKVGDSWASLVLRGVREEWIKIHNGKQKREELLKLRRSGESIYDQKPASGEVRRVSRYQLNQAVQNNLNNLLGAVDARPVMNDGSILGFRIRDFRGKPGKLLKRLGFREGDLIQRVNGRPVNSVERAMGVWTQLKNKRSFRVQILRGGETRTLEYSLAR